jgi:hypothetical protein
MVEEIWVYNFGYFLYPLFYADVLLSQILIYQDKYLIPS